MGLLRNSLAMFYREMLIYKANIFLNISRMLIISIVYIWLFGFIGGSTITNIPVAIVNYANTAQSFQFISSLQLQQGIYVTQLTDQTSAMQLLQSGDVSLVVLILPGFPDSSPSVHVYYSNTQASTTNFALATLEQSATLFAMPGGFQDKFHLPAPASQNLVVSTPINGATGSYKDYIFPGIIIMVVAFSAVFNGITIITDRLGGNVKTFITTPINKSAIILGRTMATCVQSVVSLAIILAIGYANGSTVAMGWSGLVFVLGLGVLIAVAFSSTAAIIASRTNDIQSCTILCQLIAIVFWMLSGGLFSILSLPTWLQGFSAVDPMTYATAGMRSVVLLGSYPLGNMVLDFSVLAAYAALATAISIVAFKDTID